MSNEPIKESHYRGTHLALTSENLQGSQAFTNRINKNLFISSVLGSRRTSWLVCLLKYYWHSILPFSNNLILIIFGHVNKSLKGLFPSLFNSIYKCSIIFKPQIPSKLNNMFTGTWHRKWRGFMGIFKTHFCRQSRLREPLSKGWYFQSWKGLIVSLWNNIHPPKIMSLLSYAEN